MWDNLNKYIRSALNKDGNLNELEERPKKKRAGEMNVVRCGCCGKKYRG